MVSKTNVLPADTYILIDKAFFSDNDRKLITMLYQPIIGSIATSLYFTLWSFLELKNGNEFTHYNLMTSMQLGLDSIIEAREKLEAIGLIKTYMKKEKAPIKNFIYEVYAPVSAYEFISSPLLNTLLINSIGNDEYQKNISYFKTNNMTLENYDDITSSFSQIFKISKGNLLENLDENIKKTNKNKINIETNIDLDSILSLIPDEVLNKKSVTNETYFLLKNLSFIYNFNDEQMKEVIEASIDVAHKLDNEKLKVNSRSFYEFNNSGKLPGIIYKKQPENLKNNLNDDSKKSKMVYTFENTSPYDFLASKYGNSKPTKTDLKLIEYLLVELKLTPGVVNVLIDYVLKTNNNKLTRVYVETIAGQWKRNNVTTVMSAIELAKREYQNIQKVKQKTVKKNISSSPKWVDKKIEATIATKEEEEKLSKMLKELVGE